MEANQIQRFPKNESGRDFVIGDLHGMTEFLFKLLDYVCFDPAKDRLFSVGDLIDRGGGFGRCAKTSGRALVSRRNREPRRHDDGLRSPSEWKSQISEHEPRFFK